MNNKCLYEEGCSLPSSDNTLDLIVARLTNEVKKLAEDTEYKLLLHDGKIAEMCVYIKENLSNELRILLDSMKLSGELDNLITSTITNLQPQIDNINNNVCALVKNASKFKLYAPSLLNRLEHESIALLKNCNYAILFDTGVEISEYTNLNYLKNILGNQKINTIVISHYHLDHIGGLNRLIELLSDDAIVYLPMNFNGYLNGSDDINELNTIRTSVINTLTGNGIKYVEVSEDTILTYDELQIKLFNSNVAAYNHYKGLAVGYNAYSMNALVSLGDTKVLFPGDSNQYTQDYLVLSNQVEKVSIYATNHHGFERYVNSEYLSRLNPDLEYYSVSPYTWDDVNMLSYDYDYKNRATRYITEAFDDIEITLTKQNYQVVKGYYCNDNMFINKTYEIYINPEYAGVPDGTKEKPFRTINQALTTLPREGCNITIHFAPGLYEKLRFISTSNLLQVVADGEVTFKDVQMNNISAIYFNGIKFINNVVGVYGYVYFSNCSFECSSNASGNICITLNRINASFNNCTFSNCYTGIYSQANCQVTAKGCTIDAVAYAIYSLNSFVSIENYTIVSGTIRGDIGSVIKTVDKGATDKRPLFNNSDYMRGYVFFDTKLGKPIFYYNLDGVDRWIDANGQAV